MHGNQCTTSTAADVRLLWSAHLHSRYLLPLSLYRLYLNLSHPVSQCSSARNKYLRDSIPFLLEMLSMVPSSTVTGLAHCRNPIASCLGYKKRGPVYSNPLLLQVLTYIFMNWLLEAFGRACVYLLVVTSDLWPSVACTRLTGAWLSSECEACACLNQ